MKNIVFHPEAEEEMTASAEYYESKAAGLGLKFLDEVDHGLTQISTNPYGWPFHSEQARRYLLRRFPYGLLYQVYADHVYIVAVMHLHREPNYWKHRLKP
jgi:plasmid stabilization system protein ParE